MPRSSFNYMRRTFRHKLHIDSEWVILHRIAILSQVEPVKYHCCINSCIAYAGKYTHHLSCPFCNETRLTKDKQPRRIFSYLPLIPRLQGFFQSQAMINKLSYRRDYEPSDNEISDVFDGIHYRTLQQTNVTVDGVERPYKYFSGKHDIAFSLCTDAYLLFKHRRKGPSATPITIQIYNLPPQIRIHLDNLICLGIIPPGLHQPKDITSFLAPYDDERAQLALGIRTFDASDHTYFDLHAYTIFGLGDIVAIEKFLGIKGHNAYCPCRSCTIKGVRNISGGGKIYYIPLATPNVDHQTRPSVDPHNLPLRTHLDFESALQKVSEADTSKQREALRKYYGIRGSPALRRVGSLDFGESFPWDWMHLFCENIIPNLLKLWTGSFKGLNTGIEDYEIPHHIWAMVGSETANAVKDIPASFVRVLGNIAEDRSTFTAESYGFWFMYLAPILLKGRFRDDTYYVHMCALVDIMKTTLQFSLTLDKLDELKEKIVEWVEEYKRYVH
jgi:hypothetical protein